MNIIYNKIIKRFFLNVNTVYSIGGYTFYKQINNCILTTLLTILMCKLKNNKNNK